MAPTIEGRPLRVVVLTQWFPPEGAPLPSAIVDHLVLSGHDVTVLTGFPNYPSGRLFPGWSQARQRTTQESGYVLRRVALYPSHDRSPARRVLNYLSFAVSATVSGWRTLRRADVVYVYHPPLTAAMGPWLSRLLGGPPFVLHIQDLWPDSVVHAGLLERRAARIAGVLLSCACATVYRRATTLITIAPTMSALVTSRGVSSDKVVCIPNWADEDNFHPPEPEPTDRGFLGLEGTFSVMFAGNVGDVQGLEFAVRAAALVMDEPSFRLVVVGDGVALPAIKSLAEQLGAANVVFVEPQPITRMNSLMREASVQLVTLRNYAFLYGTIPSKLGGILAAGLPVICTAPGDAAEVVRAADAGWTANPEDDHELARCFRRASATSRDELEQLGRNARVYYIEHLSRHSALTRIEGVLTDAGRIDQ